MKRKQEKGTEKIRREPPAAEFGGEQEAVRPNLIFLHYEIKKKRNFNEIFFFGYPNPT